jgi:hypothetical protein
MQKEYAFTLILAGLSEFTDDVANRLYAVCTDATAVSRDGVAFLHFDRSAASLEEAMRSAVADVMAAGCTVAKLEIAADELAAV